jgi:DNA-binding NarL/FixJ family response regulator
MALRIVIVDDSLDFLDAARDALQKEGAIVEGSASTSAEALHLAEALQPDVILVDVHLGDESGLELAQRLAEAHDTPIVLISAYLASELADLIVASAAIGFVSKSELSATTVSNLLRSASS